MKKTHKLIILILLSSSIYFIYLLTNQNSITYIALGDAFAKGENSFGGNSYSYPSYLRDFINDYSKIRIYSDHYSSKNKDIKLLYNDILKDENIVVDNNQYNLKKLLQEANIITISIGLNDVIYEYNVLNKESISSYEEDRIIEYIFNNYKELISEIRKYTKRNIYVVSYPTTNNNKYNNLIKKLNKKYKQLSTVENNNLTYINSEAILKSNKNFDTSDSIFPNSSGYKLIATSIINDYKHKNFS